MQILFYDVTTPVAYTYFTLQQQALRGTEATVVRIAHALKAHHQVYVAQHCRQKQNDEACQGVHYISCETAQDLSPDVVVLLRQANLLSVIAKQFPQARLFFWMHNLPSCSLFAKQLLLAKYQYEIIAVSQFHRAMIEKRLQGKWYQRFFRGKTTSSIPIHVLYNPVDDDLKPDQTPWNPNQLLFTSSPYKGLPETLKAFHLLRKHFPHYELCVTSPLDTSQHDMSQHVRYLNDLPHHELIQQLRQSFCVFYPQTQRIETFGLVYAEANAVGTPVLAHDFGAAREVLSDASQLVDGKNFQMIIEKIKEWRENRPMLEVKSAFRLHHVTQAWLALIAKNNLF